MWIALVMVVEGVIRVGHNYCAAIMMTTNANCTHFYYCNFAVFNGLRKLLASGALRFFLFVEANPFGTFRREKKTEIRIFIACVCVRKKFSTEYEMLKILKIWQNWENSKVARKFQNLGQCIYFTRAVTMTRQDSNIWHGTAESAAVVDSTELGEMRCVGQIDTFQTYVIWKCNSKVITVTNHNGLKIHCYLLAICY